MFWKELYWFLVICLGGWTLAMVTLPPRLARNRSAFETAGELERVVRRLENLEKEYEAAIAAVENDPFYRDEVYRNVLGVKKSSEDFLKKDR